MKCISKITRIIFIGCIYGIGNISRSPWQRVCFLYECSDVCVRVCVPFSWIDFNGCYGATTFNSVHWSLTQVNDCSHSKCSICWITLIKCGNELNMKISSVTQSYVEFYSTSWADITRHTERVCNWQKNTTIFWFVTICITGLFSHLTEGKNVYWNVVVLCVHLKFVQDRMYFISLCLLSLSNFSLHRSISFGLDFYSTLSRRVLCVCVCHVKRIYFYFSNLLTVVTSMYH